MEECASCRVSIPLLDSKLEVGEAGGILVRNANQVGQAFSITDRHPVFRGCEKVEFLIAFEGCEQSPTLFCRFWHKNEGEAAVRVAHWCPEKNSYVAAVPDEPCCIMFCLWLEPGQSIHIKGLEASGVSAAPATISMHSYRLAQNRRTSSFEDCYRQMAASIPESNGCGYYEKGSIKVGVITDDFMYNYYADAVDLVYLTPEDYRNQITSSHIDVVLYVSCWRGMRPPDENGLYEYAANAQGALKVVPEIFSFARSRGVTTIFQTIEDPPSYNLYLPIAKAADFIFTSCVELVPQYIEDTGNEFVFYQPYGVNPQLQNPIGLFRKYEFAERFFEDSVFFAGSWYSIYPERCADTKMMFDGVLNVLGKGLVLADRALDYPNRSARTFPSEYNEYIIAPIEHKLLQRVHKLFDFAINLNTIKDSTTMGAMRVYEVQALGCLLLSNYSLSVETSFPNVFMARSQEDFLELIGQLSAEDVIRAQLDGVRRIMTNATVFDRLNLMFAHADIPFAFQACGVKIACKLLTDEIEKSISLQTYKHIERVELEDISLLDRSGFLIILDEPLGTPNAIQDMVNAFKYVDVDYVEARVFDGGNQLGTFEYTEDTQAYRGCMYSLRRVDPRSIGDDIEQMNFKGFSILTS